MSKAKRKNDEEYGNVYEEYSANAELSTREKNANPNLNNKKLIMKKWCILFVVLSLSIGALVGSNCLSIYLMQQKDATTTITTAKSTTTMNTTASIPTITSTTTTTTSITTPGSRLLIYSDAV